ALLVFVQRPLFGLIADLDKKTQRRFTKIHIRVEVFTNKERKQRPHDLDSWILRASRPEVSRTISRKDGLWERKRPHSLGPLGGRSPERRPRSLETRAACSSTRAPPRPAPNAPCVAQFAGFLKRSVIRSLSPISARRAFSSSGSSPRIAGGSEKTPE